MEKKTIIVTLSVVSIAGVVIALSLHSLNLQKILDKGREKSVAASVRPIVVETGDRKEVTATKVGQLPVRKESQESFDEKEKGNHANDIVVEAKNGDVKGILPEDVAKTLQEPQKTETPPTIINLKKKVQNERMPPPVSPADMSSAIPKGINEYPSLIDESLDANVSLPNRKYREGSYRFNNLSPSALQGGNETNLEHDKSYNTDTFVPMSEEIYAALIDNAITTNDEIDVRAMVLRPVYWNGRLIIDKGEKLVGSAKSNGSGGKLRDLMMVKFNKIVFRDGGKSLPFNGVAVSLTGEQGIPGYRISDYAKQLIQPLLLSAASSAISAFAGNNGVTQTFSSGETITTSENGVTDKLKNAGNSVANDLSTRIQKILSEDMEEYKPYVFCESGTKFKIYLKEPLDVSQAGIGR